MRWTSSGPLAAAIVAAAGWAGSMPAAGQAPPVPASVPHPPPTAPQARFVVVLDAAHGGSDTGGKLGGNQLEKNFALAFSVRLRSLLAARGFQVVTTREQDADLDSDRRAAIANHAKAEACLILHASESGQGVHLYVSSLQQPVQQERFEAWRTAQAAWVARSFTLAGVLNGVLTHAGMTVLTGRIGMPDIDSMECPAVAVEIAPENAGNHEGSGDLDDPDYQTRVAGAIAAALLEWRSEARQP